ncbi:hypothetical protein [Streptomyces sp. CC224B]|uniref:hypothetical protein n=1 Tax=Streptomyces sp. CC224B TaxID=3044571 RepID=UPI0024A9B103|nr:hypothetical protein [Streptomyces sp. CC224B]
MSRHVNRRTVLRRAVLITAGTAIGTQLVSPTAHGAGRATDPEALRRAVRQAQQEARERTARISTGVPSKNGWDMEKVADDRGHIHTRPVPGTPLDGIQVRMGDAETILVHVVRRFHYEIDELRRGDVVGWRHPHTVRKGLAESNQASGTAVQIRPLWYPSGARNGFFPEQLVVVRDILAELDGVVRWGGDDRKADESLFYLAVPPGDKHLARVAARVRAWQAAPGEGAGAPVDVRSRKRRSAAKSLERRQRSAA